jgi:hypothetical protein
MRLHIDAAARRRSTHAPVTWLRAGAPSKSDKACGALVLLDAAITAELTTLSTTGFEVAADVCSIFIDPTGVRIRFSAVKNTAALLAHLERLVTKVPRLQLVDDVEATAQLPLLDIRFRNQDGAWPLVAAGTTFEAVELGKGSGHQFTNFDRSRIYAI